MTSSGNAGSDRATYEKPVSRCIRCGAKVGTWDDYTLYEPTLGRAVRGYCSRCGRRHNIIERSVTDA
jgi:DNA-directed RNA polymerase subunit RPC12/RpoP